MSGGYPSGLASLQGLRKVSLGHVEACDVETATEIAILAFELARNRQDVRFEACSY